MQMNCGFDMILQAINKTCSVKEWISGFMVSPQLINNRRELLYVLVYCSYVANLEQLPQ